MIGMMILHNEKFKQRKRERWLNRNSIKKNQQEIEKILNSYHIVFNIAQNCYGDYNIFITYYLNRYKIEINFEEMGYNLLVLRKLANNPTHKGRFKLIRVFTGEEIIFDIIKYLNKINKCKKYVEKRTS